MANEFAVSRLHGLTHCHYERMHRILMRNLNLSVIFIAAAVTLLGLSGCAKNPDASLSCTGGTTGRYCHLRPRMSYLGLRLGMDKQAVFQNLCEGINAGYFYDPVSTFDPSDIRNGESAGPGFAFRGPIKCSYWKTMKQSYAWSFNSKNGACLLNPGELIVLKFHADKLIYFEADCVTLII